jgi:hypothetical protein
MKQPAKWNSVSAKNASAWGKVAKIASAWSGSSVVKTKSPAIAWSAGTKNAVAYNTGKYTFDSYLLYDCQVTYDGAPDPFNTKIPTNWSTT